MKILIAEDDAVSRRILQIQLAKWGYEVISACNGNEAWEILQSADSPRLAILDWMMPGLDGVEICRRVRKEVAEPYAYLLLLTTLNGEDAVVTGMDAGADDYLAKPFNANELRARLRAGSRIIELQAELIAARENFRGLASHDLLTGLWNHEEILRILEKELARGEREGSHVSAIMADLDHFKLVNDTYGHLAGDAVLRMTANRMHSLMRPYDAIGRFGGEEFLFVLPDCDLEHAAAIAERIRLHIESEQMDTPEGKVQVTVSLGVSTEQSEENRDVNSLVQRADLALYRAKEKGRNCVEITSGE